MHQFPFNLKPQIWNSNTDMVKVLNSITPRTVVIRTPTKKNSNNKLDSDRWLEFSFSQIGTYDKDTIEIFCSDIEDPRIIIYPENLEVCLFNDIPFLKLVTKTVNNIKNTTDSESFYETIILDEKNKLFTDEEIDSSKEQKYCDRFSKGTFFIFPKCVDDKIIDFIIFQYL